MKKMIIITLIAIFAFPATINLSASSTENRPIPQSSVASVTSSATQSVVSHKTQEELANAKTTRAIEHADQFYAETNYTDKQKTEAEAALANIYQSLYLDEKDETEETKFIKQMATEYINKEYPGLNFSESSIKLMNYVSLTDLKKTGEIVFDSTYTSADTGVYTAMVEDENGRMVSMIQLSWGKEILQPAGYVGECNDLKAHAVKAYALLKETDLDLSKTTATYFRMHNFGELYYLTDGTSRYFLTFGSTNKAAGELYYEWQYPGPISNEYKMSVLKYEDMLKVLSALDTSSLVDRPIDQVDAMGGDTISSTAPTSQQQISSTATVVEPSETATSSMVSVQEQTSSVPVSSETAETDTPVQESLNSIWLWAIVIVAVVALALVVVMVVRKKKKVN